jgi:hypothetical protein
LVTWWVLTLRLFTFDQRTLFSSGMEKKAVSRPPKSQLDENKSQRVQPWGSAALCRKQGQEREKESWGVNLASLP